MALNQLFTEPLPADPLTVAADWLAEAWQRLDQPNPNAMVLATCDADGQPSARVVLCKAIEAVPGLVRFVSNYDSRKGRELAANPRAALVMHWDHQHRQLRIEGRIQRISAAQSDAYFAARPWASQLGAHGSRQSQPIASRAALEAQLAEATQRSGATPGAGSDAMQRPAHWGGYVLWAQAVELWMEGDARIHDRVRWTRELQFGADGQAQCGDWHHTRLQP